MKRGIIFMLLVAALLEFSWAQIPSYHPGERNFYEMKADFEIYFEGLAQTQGPEALREEGSEYKEFQKWVRYWEPRLAPHGDFEAYFKATHTAWENMEPEGIESYQCDPWDEVGPTQKPQGGIPSIGNGGCERGIGPVEFIQFHPQKHNWMLCGSKSGGLYFSANGAGQWYQAGSDEWRHSACRSAVFHPTKERTWFAVSHTSVDPAWLGFDGGLMKTTNAGATWKQIGKQQDMWLGIYDAINLVLIDPSNSGVFFVASTSGLRRTSNINANTVIWTRPQGIDQYNIFDIEFQHGNAQNVFAAVEDPGTKTWEFRYSTDIGQRWYSMPGQPRMTGVRNLTLETSAADPNHLYCLYGSHTAGKSEIWKYNIPNQTWQRISNNHTITHGWGHGFAISQHVDDEIYISNHDRYQTLINGSWTSYRSSDPNARTYHVDVEDFVAHPANAGEIWMANHGGVHKSTDKGQTWTNMSLGLGIAEVLGMATDQTDGENVIIATYHDGSSRTVTPYTFRWQPDWHTIKGGDGLGPAVDYENPQNMWVASQSCGDYSYSNNGGTILQYAGFYQDTWIKTLKQHTKNPNTIFCNAKANRSCSNRKSEVARSTNRGLNASYEYISDFHNTLGLQAYAIWQITTCHSTPDVLYVHLLDFDNGRYRILRTTQANASAATARNSWREMIAPVPTKWISDLEVDPYDPNILYVTYSSTTSGTWLSSQGTDMVFRMNYNLPSSHPDFKTNLTLNLPNTGGGSLAVERGSKGGMYLATDLGVYYTNNDLIDNGTEWTKFCKLPNVPISNLEINYGINRLRAGTFGRGVWEHDLYCPDLQSASQSGILSVDQYLEVRETITSTIKVPNGRDLTYRAGESITLNPGFQVQAGADFYAFIHPCNQPGNTMEKQPEHIQVEEVSGTTAEAPITESEDLLTFTLFPNPNQGAFTIKTQGKLEGQATISITNSLGKKIREGLRLDKAVSEFNLDLPAGIYFVVILYENKRQTIKMIIR